MRRGLVTRRGQQGGSLLIEFTLCAIPLMFLLISLVQMSLTMWNYHTLAEAVSYTTRIAASRGAGCVGKACATSIGGMSQILAQRAIGISPSSMKVTFASSAPGTSPVTCNPLSSCLANTTAWPSVAANTAGSDITIAATVSSTLPISMFTPKWGGFQFAGRNLAAQSRQMVVY